jgi:membrane fusion protein, heavy metal efflux system
MTMRRQLFLPTLCLATAGLLAACEHGHSHDDEHEHPEVVVTQWNDSTELFLEYPHLVAGEATGNWAIHLTDMKTFRPITEGALTVRFLQGGREVRQFTLDAPAREGIYLLDPVIEQPGTYEVHLALQSPQVTSLHVLPEVQVWADASELPQEEEEEDGGIAFLKEQQWVIPFAVQPAREQAVQRAVDAPGEIVARDGSLAQVSAPVSGIAAAVPNRAAPSVGETVRAGQVLAVLNPTAGEGGYARARGELERLEREAARAERLYAAGAIPQRRLEEARHDLEIARAEMRAIGGGGADGDFRLRVTAPISGVVARRSFLPGGRVEAGEPLFVIVDASTVWLRVQLPAGTASALTREPTPTFTIEGMDRPFETSRLVSVGSVLDPQTRTVPAVFEAPNPGGMLRIGQFARATVPVGGTVIGVAIPNSAIVDDNGTPVAYVQTGGEHFERRVLALAERDATHTVVTGGIRPGEMVVTTGAYQVRLASLSGGDFAGGHSH